MAILELENVGKSFGGLQVLSQINFGIEEGRITSVIGPNGAGKTTLFNVITGLYAPDTGSIRFAGADITRWKPDHITRVGLARSFQITNIFPRFTVLENLILAAQTASRKRWTIFARAEKLRDVEEHAYMVLERVGLDAKARMPARELSHGDQRHLEIAMAIATNPKLVLLDEPTSGVSTSDKNKIMETLVSASKKMGIKSIIQVEHDMDLVFSYSDRVIALVAGKVLADGTPEKIEKDEEVVCTVMGQKECFKTFSSLLNRES